MNNIFTGVVAIIICVSGIIVRHDTSHIGSNVTDATEMTAVADTTDYYGYTKSDYIKMEVDAKELCLQTFRNQKTSLKEIISAINDLLINNEHVSINKNGNARHYSVYDGNYNDIKSTLSAEQDQLLYNFLSKFESQSVHIWGDGNIVCFELYQNCFNAGLIWSKDTLPAYYDYYPELIELGEGWFYYRTDYME